MYNVLARRLNWHRARQLLRTGRERVSYSRRGRKEGRKAASAREWRCQLGNRNRAIVATLGGVAR